MTGPDRAGRVTFPRPISRPWVWGTVVVVAALCGWGAVTQPEPGPVIAVVFLVLAIGGALLATVRPPTDVVGTMITYRSLLRTRRIDIAGARSVALRANHAGMALLAVQGAAGGARAYLPLMVRSTYVKRAVPPDELAVILAALPAARDPRARGVAELLTAQAEHLARGGTPDTSPLAPLTNAARLRTAQGTGLLGLLDK
ncbi:MAG: hypothetical protein ACR2JQ_02610 [Mycobacteriales bacterium]